MPAKIEDLQPEDAIKYWRRRGLNLAPTFDYRDGWLAAEQNAFAIAGVVELDLLEDMHDEIGRALETGLPFDVFKENTEKIIRLHGMWGEQVVTDPITGAERTVDISTAGRLKNIFETNCNRAINEGRYDSDAEAAALRKARGLGETYLRYNVSGGRICPTCAYFDGTTRPINDPVWGYATPLLHNGGKCYLSSVTEPELKEFGYEVSPEFGDLDIREYHNSRTGHTTHGLVVTDPGTGKELKVQPGFGHRDWGGEVRAHFDAYLKKQSPINQKAIRERLAASE